MGHEVKEIHFEMFSKLKTIALSFYFMYARMHACMYVNVGVRGAKSPARFPVHLRLAKVAKRGIVWLSKCKSVSDFGRTVPDGKVIGGAVGFQWR